MAQKQTLAAALQFHGIPDHRTLSLILGCHEEHARKIWAGRTPLSRMAAEKIVHNTGGLLTFDYLFSFNDGKQGNRRRG